MLNHICADGSDFDDRVRYATQGIKPPAQKLPQLPAYNEKWRKNYDVLDLTPDDLDFLTGLHIRL